MSIIRRSSGGCDHDAGSPDAIEAEAHDLIARGHTKLAEAARLRASLTKSADATPPTAPSMQLVDKRSCAHALGVSVATLDRLVRERRIPFRVVGDCKRFVLADVLAAFEEHKATAKVTAPPHVASLEEPIPGVRLLSRRPRTPQQDR